MGRECCTVLRLRLMHKLAMFHITLKLGISAHSKKKKTLECGNHYAVFFLMLHAKTEGPVHVQPLY